MSIFKSVSYLKSSLKSRWKHIKMLRIRPQNMTTFLMASSYNLLKNIVYTLASISYLYNPYIHSPFPLQQQNITEYKANQ